MYSVRAVSSSDGGVVFWSSRTTALVVAVFILVAIGGAISGALGGILALLGFLAYFGFAVYNWVYLQGTTGQTIGKKQQQTKLLSKETGQPLGVGMATAGNFFLANKHTFGIVSGALIFVFGLHFWGLRGALSVTAAALVILLLWWLLLGQSLAERIEEAWIGLALVVLSAVILFGTGWDKIPILNREARFEGPANAGSVGASFLIGMVLGNSLTGVSGGWVACRADDAGRRGIL